MSSDLEKLVQHLREEGPRRFSAWDPGVFEAFLVGPISNLTRNLETKDKNARDPHVLPNYLRMVFEGIGAGWLGPPDDDVPARTFLAHCLQTLMPWAITRIPQSQRNQVLRQVWNLGEGLAKEPQWLNQYAITQTTWSIDMQNLDQHLAKILDPVLAPAPPSDWAGKYQLTVLDLRQQLVGFVPGNMNLASPVLLCIANRIDPRQNVAILLQKKGRSKILGAVGRLPEYVEAFPAPEIEAHANDISINARVVSTPLLSSVRQTLCIAAGFVAVTAEDSQRLWLLEAA